MHATMASQLRVISSPSMMSASSLFSQSEGLFQAMEDIGNIESLPVKKRGRQVPLVDNLDSKVQTYLKKVHEGGGVVSARIAMAAARGIVLTCDRSMLAKFGGHAHLSRHWAYSWLY